MKEKMDFFLNFWGSILLILICITALGFSIYFLIEDNNIPNLTISIIGSLVILGYSIFDSQGWQQNRFHNIF